jgi:hypothetical protein
MEEGAVTVDGIHYELPQPFWVLQRKIHYFKVELMLCLSHN